MSSNTTSKNRPLKKTLHHRISLVAGTIMMAITLLVGATIFVVMQRHAEELLSKSLQLSLQNRIQLVQNEISAGVNKTMVVATRPLLIDLMQQVNTGGDGDADRVTLDRFVQSFLPTGLTAIAVLDKDGRELARAGTFAQKPALTVPLHLPGREQLMWDGQLLLHAAADLKRQGGVVGQVVTEAPLPFTTGALKDVSLLAETGELALCAPFGLNMQCFPMVHNPKTFTLPKRSPKGVPLPMAYALEGETGFITARDYREQKVAAAYAPIGDLGLGMVLKMDSAELYASVWQQLRYLAPPLLGLLVIALLLLRWLVTPLVNRLERSEAQAHELSASLSDTQRQERAVLDNVDEGIVSISASGMIELFNPVAERLFGYRREEVIGKNVSILMPESYHSKKEGGLWRYLHTDQAHIIGVRREMTGLRSDGSVFPIELRISEFSLGGRRQFIGCISDITERKRIYDALRASEMQLRQITDNVPALIADLDFEQRFRFHNKAYEDIFGLSSEQINGHTLAEVLGPQIYAGVQDKVQEVLRGYPVRYERVQITPQGDLRNYAMLYFPHYGEGANEGKVVGFYSLGTDVTELKRIDRIKSEFISTVSHELRTPLTSIRGSLGLIAGGVTGTLPEAAKNLIGIAKNNCERLIRLVNDILDIEKIESGKMRLDLQVVDIGLLVQQALVANEGFAGQHRVTMRLWAPDGVLQVHIDSDRMIQVLTNLLSNALKFSPPDGVVEVSVLRVAVGVRVEVVDHGPGIQEEFRSRIFQKFSQADSSDVRQTGGTGLGLNISKALVEKMGGQLGYWSEVGAGATFFFELPEWHEPAILPQPSNIQIPADPSPHDFKL